MSEQVKKPIKITETILRDAHQSLIATRMPTEFMLPIVDKMDKVGYHSVECWGGATFDASLRFLKEDPWDRLRKLRAEHMVENLKEINCSVLGDCDEYQTSVCEEPIKSGEILSYEDKYMGDTKGDKGMQASQKRIPADLPEAMSDRIRFLAGETFRVLSCHGVSRVDVIVDADTDEIYVNEINTIPGSLSFYLWEATGIPFDKLMDRLVALALKRQREKGHKTVSYDQNIFSMGGGVKGGVKGKLK